jgi:hypothetical protein
MAGWLPNPLTPLLNGYIGNEARCRAASLENCRKNGAWWEWGLP